VGFNSGAQALGAVGREHEGQGTRSMWRVVRSTVDEKDVAGRKRGGVGGKKGDDLGGRGDRTEGIFGFHLGGKSGRGHVRAAGGQKLGTC
jgi:hypothetical protein